MTGELELDERVFGVKVKPAVVHQVWVAQQNNQREPWADTKGRGEVRGGGKKPWAQKGTGRARHGSIRSPIWKGGGVTFGPKSVRNYKTKINQATRRLAIRMCWSDKAKGGALWVVDQFNWPEPKTKLWAKLLQAMPTAARSWLVVTPGRDESVIRMTRNLPRVFTRRAEDVTVMDLVNRQAVIASVEAVKRVEEILGKRK